MHSSFSLSRFLPACEKCSSSEFFGQAFAGMTILVFSIFIKRLDYLSKRLGFETASPKGSEFLNSRIHKFFSKGLPPRLRVHRHLLYKKKCPLHEKRAFQKLHEAKCFLNYMYLSLLSTISASSCIF